MQPEMTSETLKRMDKIVTTVTNEEVWALFEEIKATYGATSPREIVTKFQNSEISIDLEVISKLLLIA